MIDGASPTVPEAGFEFETEREILFPALFAFEIGLTVLSGSMKFIFWALFSEETKIPFCAGGMTELPSPPLSLLLWLVTTRMLDAL